MKRRSFLQATGAGVGLDLESLLSATDRSSDRSTVIDRAKEVISSFDPRDFGGYDAFGCEIVALPDDASASDDLLDGATAVATVFGTLATVSIPVWTNGHPNPSLVEPARVLRARGYREVGSTPHGRLFLMRRRTRVRAVVSSSDTLLFGRGPAFRPVRTGLHRVANRQSAEASQSGPWQERVPPLLDRLAGVYHAVDIPPRGHAESLHERIPLRGQSIAIQDGAVSVREVRNTAAMDYEPAPGGLLGALSPETSIETRRDGGYVIRECELPSNVSALHSAIDATAFRKI